MLRRSSGFICAINQDRRTLKTQDIINTSRDDQSSTKAPQRVCSNRHNGHIPHVHFDS